MLLISYFVKLSISLGIVWLFYHLVLRKLTFYNSNRWYLLGYTLLCFFIPFIDISPVLQKNQWTDSKAVSWIPVIGDYGRNEIIPVQSNDFFTIWNIVRLVADGRDADYVFTFIVPTDLLCPDDEKGKGDSRR